MSDDVTPETKKTPLFIKYLIAVVVGLIIAVAIGFTEQHMYNGVKFPLLRLGCDGLFVAGVFLLASGGLAYVTENGGFDALQYAVFMLVSRIKHPHPDHREEDYYEFVKDKKSRRKPRSVVFLIITGAVFVALAAAMIPFVPDFDPAYAG